MQSISSTGLGREERKRDQAKAPKLPGAYRTRREAASYLQSRGYPISYSTLTKVCALGEGPPPAKMWGKRPLYIDPMLDTWAEDRSRRPRNEPAEPSPPPQEVRTGAPVSEPAPVRPTGGAARRPRAQERADEKKPA